MPGPIPCLGYRSRTEAALALEGEGLNVQEISERIGIDTKDVQSLLYYGKNKSKCAARRRRGWDDSVRTVAIANVDLNALDRHARKRGIHVNELVRRLVAAIAEDELVDSVLDDADANAELGGVS